MLMYPQHNLYSPCRTKALDVVSSSFSYAYATRAGGSGRGECDTVPQPLEPQALAMLRVICWDKGTAHFFPIAAPVMKHTVCHTQLSEDRRHRPLEACVCFSHATALR